MAEHSFDKFVNKTRQFVENYEPREVNRQLRNLLLQYLIYQLPNGDPYDLPDFLTELYALFAWLDAAAEWKESWEKAEEMPELEAVII